VSGQRQFQPSIGQVCDLLPVTPPKVRAELKARAAANGNGNVRLSDEAAYFVAMWSALSTTDREAAVKAMGVAEVWDVLSKGFAWRYRPAWPPARGAPLFGSETSHASAPPRAAITESRARPSCMARHAGAVRFSFSRRWLALTGRSRNF